MRGLTILYTLPSLEEAALKDLIFNGEISDIAKEWTYSIQEVCLIYMMLGNRSEIEECLRFAVDEQNFYSAYKKALDIQDRRWFEALKTLGIIVNSKNIQDKQAVQVQRNKKEKFMEYAKKRLKGKDYKKRKFLIDLADTQSRGFEKCANGRWRRGQP